MEITVIVIMSLRKRENMHTKKNIYTYILDGFQYKHTRKNNNYFSSKIRLEYTHSFSKKS